MNDQVSEVLYRRLKAVQRSFGLARLELGTLLEVFRNNEALWKGRASSFHAFLEEERIQSSAAYQFMRVSKRFVLELGLSDAELAEIATVNFRILDLASKIITEENKEEVLALVQALGERDARVALRELGAEEPGTATYADPPEVRSLERRFRELPDDYRLAFLAKFERQRQTGRHSRSASR